MVNVVSEVKIGIGTMDTVFTKWLTCELANPTMNAAKHSYVAALKCNTGNLTMLSGSTRKKGHRILRQRNSGKSLWKIQHMNLKDSFAIRNCDPYPEDYTPVSFRNKNFLNDIWVSILPSDLTIDMWITTLKK